jgi:hypothetical protein
VSGGELGNVSSRFGAAESPFHVPRSYEVLPRVGVSVASRAALQRLFAAPRRIVAEERRGMEQATTEPPLKPPKRKLRWWHVVLIVIPGLLVIGVITKAVLSPPNNGAGASPSSDKFTVSVTGSAGAHVDIDVNYNGRWSQLTNQSLPWSDSLGIGIVSVAAENSGRSGSITCTITNSDGSVRDTQTSTGPYEEVACNTTPAISGTSGSAGNSGAAGNS